MEAKIGADLMYRRCRFVYAVQEVHSKQCGENYNILAGNSDYSPLELSRIIFNKYFLNAKLIFYY